MKTILITGINGYLGSELAKKLMSNYFIIGIEHDTTDLFRLKDFRFEVFSSKIGFTDLLFSKHKVDIIIHTATLYGRNNEPDSELFYTNMYIPICLMETAMKSGCQMFINCDTTLNPFTSSYALSKHHFNNWLEHYSNQNKIKVINVRMEHFYGPGASEHNFVISMIKRMIKNELSIAVTKATHSRNFVYIDDLLDAFVVILDGIGIQGKNFDTIYIGTGDYIIIKDLLELIKSLTYSNSVLDYGAVPYRKDEVNARFPDESRLLKMGWVPKVRITDGLRKTIDCERKCTV